MNEDIISCHLHDYIEIACLYRLQVRVTLVDGVTVTGSATGTGTGTDKKEYLVIEPPGKDPAQKIDLTRIKRLQALTRNPHFDRVDF